MREEIIELLEAQPTAATLPVGAWISLQSQSIVGRQVSWSDARKGRQASGCRGDRLTHALLPAAGPTPARL